MYESTYIIRCFVDWFRSRRCAGVKRGTFQLAVSEPVSDVSSATVASTARVQATHTLIAEFVTALGVEKFNDLRK